MASRRSAAACLAWKTKCDLVIRGSPCSACTADARPASACVQRPNKRYRRQNYARQNASEHHHHEDHLSPASGELHNPQVSTPQSSASGSRAAQPTRIDFSGDSAVIISLTAKDATGSLCEVDFRHTLDARHALDSADHAYLEAKGVFALPRTDICDKLIRGFFSHVHPWFPVIDAAKFLTKYGNGGPTDVDLVLLWAVLMAGSESAGPDLVTLAGFTDRLHMADAFYRDESARKKALQLRRWHCCLANDAWEAVASGCPLKITRSESQVAALSAEDILEDFNHLDPIIRQRFISGNIERLIKYAVSYSKSVSVLRNALHQTNGPDSHVPSTDEIDSWVRDLMVIEQDIVGDMAQDTRSSDECVQLTAYRFQIHHGATHIALLRPYLFVTPSSLVAQEKLMWECKMKRDMTATAGKVISTLETVIGAQLLSHLGHGLTGIIVPVAQYCLVQLTSQQEDERKIAQHRFDSCMIIIEELRKIDGHALTLSNLLKAARNQLVLNLSHGSSGPDSSVVFSDQGGPNIDINNVVWEDWDTAMTTVFWNGLSPLGPA
ncbi:fungal transcription factor regulatory middle homology region [Fusarium longipes]|uniref:Fungal transcription factor regulatory middle homology region n=1 Tax=Fusarium longipes TaxID=694270 RepID=A0A395T7U1_9HYPO|nr:fungal transcription factor regulatory middle homology region [Fusarium longipes]